MNEADSISAYLLALRTAFESGHATEHTYRPALEKLFADITKLRVHNEPKRSEHGQPDFIFVKENVPIAWAEAKDITVNLDKTEKSEQMGRYFGYANLILTNGIEFRFFKNGTAYGEPIVIAEIQSNSIESKNEHFANFVDRLTDFIAEPIDTIRSAEHLAKIMGGKGRRLRDNIIDMFSANYGGNTDEIRSIFAVIKERLIHDLTEAQFADIYAQTLVYGLFVARYHDDTPENFSRREARDRIPTSNHLLQQFFNHIAGPNFEKRLSFIVDELCDVFVHSDVKSLVHGLYKIEKENSRDPIIHFYEDFLREYDPKLRTERGVFYTPLPVVKYIVRSVDKILQKHFALPEGLADRAQIEWKYTEQGKSVKKLIDRVQVLDPAVGTGTFLHEVIRQVHERFKGQEGIWNQYVNDHLLPRLHGFELMMASYTIAHLKLSMTLKETGVDELRGRLRVFLTNSLEEAPEKDDTLFRGLGIDAALTEEALFAEEVKRDYPIMVVVGNPPYSGESNNKGLLDSLMESYKMEPGGKEKLKERNSKWINDDYVKFIRFSEHLLEKNGHGVLAFITNHSYLDNPTFRGMRWHLLQTFDDIYILDLHGNSKKKEVAPDGGKDENVFDIQQGVAIFIGVKTSNKKSNAVVHKADLYGERENKYAYLSNNSIETTKFEKLELVAPNLDFMNRDMRLSDEYLSFVSITDLFGENNMGITTGDDDTYVSYSKEKDINDSINAYSYRPFDKRWVLYEPEKLARAREQFMQKMISEENIALLAIRRSRRNDFQSPFVQRGLIDKCILSTLDNANVFPLYLLNDEENIERSKRVANLNMEVLQPVLNKLKIAWIEDGAGNGKDTCGPEDIFDCIYAVLHSPKYRERYKEFLKIDFPRVPFTEDKKVFWQLVRLGRELRLLHLMESPKLGKLITKYPVSGSNEVEKPRYEDGKVWINKEQHFDSVPEDAWNFPIGGYEPAQKWLKDRKGRVLDSDDILHYQKMIVALVETGKLMEEIDKASTNLFPSTNG